jgi:hypothetical protein
VELSGVEWSWCGVGTSLYTSLLGISPTDAKRSAHLKTGGIESNLRIGGPDREGRGEGKVGGT